MSETNEKSANSSLVNTVLKEVDSLLDISSSSLDASSPSTCSELKQIVTKALEEIQAVPHCGNLNVNEILEAALPKIRSELLGCDTVYKEVQNIKKLLESYVQQVQAVDQDIAEIFLDLHNIYRRLEKIDVSGRKLSSPKKAKLLKHVKESEELLNRSRHYLSNDPKEMSAMLVGPPKESPSISKVRGRISKSSNPNNDRYQGGLIPFGPPYERKFLKSHKKNIEKFVFLTNMVTFKKSDYSLNLNRFKTYFGEVKRVLNLDCN